MKLATPLILSLCIINACSTIQPVRVLPDGETRWHASVGGPVVPGKSPSVVVPYLTAGAEHGMSGDISVTWNVHALMAVFKTFGIDGGVAFRVLREDNAVPELTAKGQLTFFSNFQPGATRVFPGASVVASYDLAGGMLTYLGIEAMIEFTGDKHAYLTPVLGVQYPLSSATTLQLEAKWLAANVRTAHGVFEGISSFDGRGSFALFLGSSFAF